MQLPNLENQEKQKQRPTKLTKQKSAIKRGNKPQAPLASEQRCPALAVWWGYLRFGEDICGLPLWRDMDQVYVSSFMVISQEVESDIYVFGSGV